MRDDNIHNVDAIRKPNDEAGSEKEVATTTKLKFPKEQVTKYWNCLRAIMQPDCILPRKDELQSE